MVKKGQRIRYPKNRKPPVQHHVSSHTRGGHRVSGYTRGSGTRQPQSRPSKVVGEKVTPDTSIGPHGFVFNFKYSNKKGDGESVLVTSDTYEKALAEAFEEKFDPRMPIEIECIDPDLGAMIKWVGEKAKATGEKLKEAGRWAAPRIMKATHLGAKYAVKGTYIAGKTAKKVIKGGLGATRELAKIGAYKLHTGMIRRMLKNCYARDPATRAAARYALKKQFPEIFDMCDFSREKVGWRKRAPGVIKLPKRTRSIV